jgi:hypothetical protein
MVQLGSPVLNLGVAHSLRRSPISGSGNAAVRLPVIGGLRPASSDLRICPRLFNLDLCDWAALVDGPVASRDVSGESVGFLEDGAVGALAVGVADGADDEADVCVVESAERVVEVDGDADGDAGGQPQYPVLPAAAGQEPVSRLVMAACQSMRASSVAPSDSEVPVVMKRAKSGRRSHPVR